MHKKINFNVIEKNKYNDMDTRIKHIQSIIDKLIIKEFANNID